jgi:hypothetical protein
MATTHVNVRVQRYRDAMRLAGMRPVEIWVTDTRRPGFLEECQRQSRLVVQADIGDANMVHLMEEVVADVDGWTK